MILDGPQDIAQRCWVSWVGDHILRHMWQKHKHSCMKIPFLKGETKLTSLSAHAVHAKSMQQTAAAGCRVLYLELLHSVGQAAYVDEEDIWLLLQ